MSKEVIDFIGFHPRHGGVAIVGAGGFDGFQEVRSRRVVACLQKRWHAVHFLEETLAPFACLVVLIPVPFRGQVKTLCGIKTQCEQDRKSVVKGKKVSVRVELGGRRIRKKKENI